VQILKGVSEIELPPSPFWRPEIDSSSGTSTPAARSSLEHPQRAPGIRSLERVDTESCRVPWVYPGHLTGWGPNPLPVLYMPREGPSRPPVWLLVSPCSLMCTPPRDDHEGIVRDGVSGKGSERQRAEM
jgi:hypothetical protein